MTERGKRHAYRDAREFRVGPSGMRWTGEYLDIHVDEWSVPIPRRVRGNIRVYPAQLSGFVTQLDDAGIHHWGPIAPSGRVEVNLASPGLSWNGHAYLDCNQGTQPISTGFRTWDWSRAELRDGSVAVLYDIRQKSGPDRLLALRFDRQGEVTTFDAPERHRLPYPLWRVERNIRSDPDIPPRVIQTLEDAPFYARSVLSSGLLGERVTSVHESLDIPKLDRASTRLMLPWRMPRVR
jgi:carotenoid 1,2-hydratase